MIEKIRITFGALILVLTLVIPLLAKQENSRSRQIKEALEHARLDLIEIRRDIHQHPEVSGKEERTSRLVSERLRTLGLEVETGVGGHGVIGVLKGNKPGTVVAYRADMDAVYSEALDPVPFRSKISGVRHICGHDIHTTVALGVVEALVAVQDDLPGTVKFIFQPSEENWMGALAMMRDGVLENPTPTAIFAVHCFPGEVGQIGVVDGMVLPGADQIVLTVSGKGDTEHAAQTYADIISSLSTIGPLGSSGPSDWERFIYARAHVKMDPSNSSQWIVRGFVKASSEEDYASAKSTFNSQLSDLTLSDIHYKLDYQDRLYPDLINDSYLVKSSLDPIRTAIGDDGLILVPVAVPYFGEDFVYYQQKIPGVMYWLGVSNSEKGFVGMPHSPGFVADDESVIVGARAMSAVLLDYLENH